MKIWKTIIFRLVIFTRLIFIHTSLTKILETENYFKDLEPLTMDLLHKTRSSFCYALITDAMYQIILQRNIFLEISSGSSYVIIKIQDQEDMLSPSQQIVQSLLEARRSGCRTYLIYMANGIQVERMLKYIDKSRLINPMAQLIMLHDYRLFRQELHFIWRRYINVVFVRQAHSDFRTNSSSSSRWLELSTVPFPLPVKDFYIDKQLDFWRNGKYRKKSKLFMDKTLNLKEQTLKTVVLKHVPGVQTTSGENITEYSGLEIEIIRTIANAMNFTPDFYETVDSDTEKWGRIKENGSVTGLLEEMIEGNAAFALANLYFIPYNLDQMDLTLPYTAQCLTFLTPEAYTDNSWQTLILPFSWEMWTGVILILIFVGVIFYTLARIHVQLNRKMAKLNTNHSTPVKDITSNYLRVVQMKQKKLEHLTANSAEKLSDTKFQVPTKLSKDIFDSFGNCILYTYSMLLVVSLPRLPRGWSIRLLTGWYWIYCILVVVAYRASLTAILANPAPRVTIDTLQELADRSITSGAWGTENKQFFLQAIDATSQKIGSKMEEIDNAEEAVERVAHGRYAYYENEHFLKELRSRRDSDEDQQTLHIMKECAIQMPISIGMERNSPLKPRVNSLLRRLQEAGLISKWLTDSIRSFESSTETEPQEALMDLKKLFAAFVALGIGYLMALIILIGEIIHWKFVISKNPKFDEYSMRQFYQQQRKS